MTTKPVPSTDPADLVLNAGILDEVVNSTAQTFTDRLGNVKPTVLGSIESLKAFNSRGAWAATTVYAVKDLVSNAGTWYVCVVAHTSSALFATDTATKWRVFQGIPASDLAASSGSSLIGFILAGVGAVATTVQDFLRLNVREKLTGPRTYYVRTDGNDANNGLANTAGSAFLTIQAAVNAVQKTIDTNGFAVGIQVADGSYTSGAVIDGRMIGGGTLYIGGNSATPSSCTVTVSGADCFAAVNGALVDVRGFKVSTTTSGAGVLSYTHATVVVAFMDFGNCVGAHYEAGSGGVILPSGNYAISGGGSGHYHVGSEGMIFCGAITVTVVGAPTWSAYFAGCAEGSISCGGVTFTSTFGTGPFFLAHKNGTIDIGGNNIQSFFPGSTSGTTNTGGVIATTSRTWNPTITFATPGNLAITYSARIGVWSRVGDLVFVTCQISCSAFTHTTASGALSVTGLPWIADASAGICGVTTCVYSGITKAGYSYVGAVVGSGSTAVNFYTSGSALPITAINAADMPTGGTPSLWFTLVYKAATV